MSFSVCDLICRGQDWFLASSVFENADLCGCGYSLVCRNEFVTLYHSGKQYASASNRHFLNRPRQRSGELTTKYD